MHDSHAIGPKGQSQAGEADERAFVECYCAAPAGERIDVLSAAGAAVGGRLGLGMVFGLGRWLLPAPRNAAETNRSSNPRVPPSRFIRRLLHCSEGPPRLLACSESVLPWVSSSVSTRTRSWDLYSASVCQTLVLCSIGASLKKPAPAA